MPSSPIPSLACATAAITGSSSGIGRAIALTLADAGVHCVIHARANRVGADETAELVRAKGVEAQVLVGDLGEIAVQDEIADTAWQWREGVDIWINNAGADVLTGPPAEWSFERKLEELLRVDVVATLRLSRIIGARMKARGRGAIVNVGWDQAAHGMAGDSGELFAASKGSIMAFSKSLARSLAPEVRVNCVAPGWIKTKWGVGASEAWQTRAASEALLGRWGTPEDVAGAVRFLVSAEGSFVTGQILPVNGGLKTS